MTSDRSEELSRRAAATRFRLAHQALTDGLSRLLGASAGTAISDRERAASIAAEFWAGLHAAEPNDWAFVAREWSDGERDRISDVLHRLNAYLGPRSVWLSSGAREPQALALTSDLVLDNPFGFAALADSEVRLLDQETGAGMWLGRHTHTGLSATRFTWELNVWGEPWLSAATRTFREAAG